MTKYRDGLMITSKYYDIKLAHDIILFWERFFIRFKNLSPGQ